MSFSTTIYNDAIAVEGVNEPSRKKYLKVCCEFKEKAVNSGEFEERMPTEHEFAEYFQYLRLEKKLSSSTLWTTYSTPLFIGGANSGGAASKLITNDQQVFVIQQWKPELLKLFICFLYIILNKQSYFLFDKLKLISFYNLRAK